MKTRVSHCFCTLLILSDRRQASAAIANGYNPSASSYRISYESPPLRLAHQAEVLELDLRECAEIEFAESDRLPVRIAH
jgi:hypothetical protein